MTESAWVHTVGEAPFTVRVFEHVGRGRRLYLRWWNRSKGNWAYRALGRGLRTQGDRIIKHVQQWAIAEAEKQLGRLVSGEPAALRPAAQLSLGDTVPLLLDVERGPYPADTPHRREVLRALQYAIRIFGPDRLWNSLERADLRAMGRRRVRELKDERKVGLRGAEITVSRFLTVAEWLRGERLIDERAVPIDPKWRKLLAAEVDAPDPARPRYSPEEMRALVRDAGQVDPRLGLLVSLGAELRLGQVLRARRTHLTLEQNTFEVRGRGKKRGAMVHLTAGQRAAVDHALTDGYLRVLEQTAPDFPLFPAGQLRGGRKGQGVALAALVDAQPINRRTVIAWWRKLEERCGITHIPGRAAYGVRRVAVDEAVRRGISRDGLKEHGGWSDTQVPERIYRDRDRVEARDEARETRAEIRGETA